MGPSFGSGTNLLGAQASQVLGMPPGAMQQSPASPGFQPGLMPPPAGPRLGPNLSAMGATPQSIGQGIGQALGNGQSMNQLPPEVQSFNNNMMQGRMPQPTVGLPPESAEAQLILQALSHRLKSLSKVSEATKIPSEPLVR